MILPEILSDTLLGLVCYAAVAGPFLAWFHLCRNRDPGELGPGERTVTEAGWRAQL